MRLRLIMGRVTSACDKEIILNKPNLALPHGSGEVPPIKRYSHFMRKFVATVARFLRLKKYADAYRIQSHRVARIAHNSALAAQS